MVWTWAVVFIASLICEIVTVELASIWFTLGSLVSFILALGDVSVTIQVIVFIAVSVLTFACLRPICMKLLKNSKETTNVDSLIGSVHKLQKEVGEEVAGEIKINGVSWRAVSKENLKIAVGENVKIIEVQGNRLFVEPLKEEA